MGMKAKEGRQEGEIRNLLQASKTNTNGCHGHGRLCVDTVDSQGPPMSDPWTDPSLAVVLVVAAPGAFSKKKTRWISSLRPHNLQKCKSAKDGCNTADGRYLSELGSESQKGTVQNGGGFEGWPLSMLSVMDQRW